MKMGKIKNIVLLMLLFIVVSCGSTGTLKNQKLSKAEDKYQFLARTFTSAPKNPELTADVKVKIGMGTYDATLMMRWNESIRISVTPLGIMEIMRVECLPDMIVFVDKTTQQYAVEHYANVPYRNFTGLDFYTLQALLWNRIFVPGYTDMESISQRIKLSETIGDGVVFTSTEYDYKFNIDESDRLTKTSKEGLGYSVSVDYKDFKMVSEGHYFPQTIGVEFRFTGNVSKVEILLDDISVEKSDWPNRVPISKSFTRNSIKGILEKFSL